MIRNKYIKARSRLSNNKYNQNPTTTQVNTTWVDIPGSYEIQLASNIDKKAKRAVSEWQAQFETIRQIKFYYGYLTNFHKIVGLAHSKNLSLISVIESRLDVVCVRAFFATSIFQARFLITRGFIKVQRGTEASTVVRAPDYFVEIGQVISCDPTLCSSNILSSSIYYNSTLPSHLFKPHSFSVLFLNIPSPEQVFLPASILPSKLSIL